MRKTLFTGLAGLSLLICIATLILWVRSYWVYDSYENLRMTDFDQHDPLFEPLIWTIYSNHGVIGGLWWRWKPIPTNARVSDGSGAGSVAGPPQFSFSSSPGRFGLRFPHWLLVIMTSALPIFWLIRFRHHRRIASEGLCPKCGYDLRASSERCPECGTAIAPLSPSPIGRGSG